MPLKQTKKNPRSVRERLLTEAQFQDLHREQDGKCAICGLKEMNDSRTELFVDHCHTWGHVRGLLCRCCNGGVAMFHDDPKLLEAAIRYLKDHGWPLLGSGPHWEPYRGKVLSKAEFLAVPNPFLKKTE
jgi:hypothetical protein